MNFAIGISGGDGTLMVEDGASVSSTSGKIGTLAGSTGAATVTGMGSSWIMSGDLLIGDQATGTLNIAAGGIVSAATTSLGLSPGSGTVTVSGAGSTLTSSNVVVVGESGPGALTVEAGGTVSSSDGLVAMDTAAPGTVTVSGAGSTWSNSGNLIVGVNGSGTLNIDAGGSVSCAFALLGDATGSANANVGGAGSAWTIAGDLRMSQGDANASLTITGGTVSIGGDVIDGGAATSTITLDGGTLDMTGGSIGGAVPINNLNFQSGTLENVAQINNGAPLVKTTAGTLTLDGTNTYTGVTAVLEGAVVFKTRYLSGSGVNIADGAVIQLAPSATTPNDVVLRTNAISPNASGKLDVTDNKVIVPGGNVGTVSGDIYTGLTGLIQSAHNGGAWSGAGITTSMPAAQTGLTSLGIATADQTGYAGGTFGGVSVIASDVLIMYTYGGDANLDGIVSGDDYTAIDFNILVPGAFGWVNGDFNYDGIISGDDYTVIDFNILAQGAPFPTGGGGGGGIGEAAGTVAAVPEPAAQFLLMTGAGALAARRRRSK